MTTRSKSKIAVWLVVGAIAGAAAALLCTQAGPRRQTVSPLLAEEFGVFLRVSGKVLGDDRRRLAYDERKRFLEITAVNDSPVSARTLEIVSRDPDFPQSLRIGETAELGGYESLAAEGFPDAPGEPTVMHTEFGIKNVFVVMRR